MKKAPSKASLIASTQKYISIGTNPAAYLYCKSHCYTRQNHPNLHRIHQKMSFPQATDWMICAPNSKGPRAYRWPLHPESSFGPACLCISAHCSKMPALATGQGRRIFRRSPFGNCATLALSIYITCIIQFKRSLSQKVYITVR